MLTKEEKQDSLDMAIIIIKEYARGGGDHPGPTLSSVYSTLNELKDDIKKED